MYALALSSLYHELPGDFNLLTAKQNKCFDIIKECMKKCKYDIKVEIILNGTAHAAIGAAAGYVAANTVHASPSTTLLLVGLGSVSGLVPDLDIDGKLRDRLTLSHEVVQTVAQIIGILMIIYSFYEGSLKRNGLEWL